MKKKAGKTEIITLISVSIMIGFLGYLAGVKSQNKISDFIAYTSLVVSIMTLLFAAHIYRRLDLDKTYKTEEQGAVKQFLVVVSEFKFELLKYKGNNHYSGQYFTKHYAKLLNDYILKEPTLSLFFDYPTKLYLDRLQKRINHPYFPVALRKKFPKFITEELEHLSIDRLKEWGNPFFYTRLGNVYLETAKYEIHKPQSFIYGCRTADGRYSGEDFINEINILIDSLTEYYEVEIGFVPGMLTGVN
nr:hypothetical protein [Pseudopedobacter sp.]